MISRESCYCVVTFVSYLIGTVWFAAQCVTRIIWGIFFDTLEDWFLLIIGLAIFLIHYLLLWYGSKKQLINRFIIYGLTILDCILYGILIGGWTLILVYGKLSFGFDEKAVTSTIQSTIISAITLALRLFSNRRILNFSKAKPKSTGQRGRGDSSPVSSETDPIDPN